MVIARGDIFPFPAKAISFLADAFDKSKAAKLPNATTAVCLINTLLSILCYIILSFGCPPFLQKASIFSNGTPFVSGT